MVARVTISAVVLAAPVILANTVTRQDGAMEAPAQAAEQPAAADAGLARDA